MFKRCSGDTLPIQYGRNIRQRKRVVLPGLFRIYPFLLRENEVYWGRNREATALTLKPLTFRPPWLLPLFRIECDLGLVVNIVRLDE